MSDRYNWCQEGVKLNTGVKLDTVGAKNENVFILDIGVKHAHAQYESNLAKSKTEGFINACHENIALYDVIFNR